MKGLWQGPMKTVQDLQQWVQRNYWTSEQVAGWVRRYVGERMPRYKEGAWDPEITGSTSDPTVTYTSRVGEYTIHGNICHYFGQMVVNTYSGGSGDLRLSLPVPVRRMKRGVVRTNNVDYPAGAMNITFGPVAGQSYGRITADQDAGASANLQVGAISDGDTIEYSGEFFI